MKVKAIIFDLDGTLLNTSPDITIMLNDALSECGLPSIGEEQVKAYLGNGAREIVRRATPDSTESERERVLEIYKRNFSYCKNDRTTLFDGETDTLKAVKKSGIKIAALSNKPHEAALGVCDKFFREFEFSVILGQSTEFPYLKPSPEGVYIILDKLGVDKSECVLVGDGDTDVMTAKNAGIKCISVLWGYRSKAQLKAAGATCFANSFYDLSKLLNL